jgi:hypothetical protein
MKSIAMSKAGERWESATVHWEASVGDRRADVLVEFPQRHHRYGEGIAIECQYKHEEKDTEAVTEDFLNNDYSVLWLYEEQYSGKDVNLDGGDWAIWWIKQIPDQQEWSGYHGIVHWLHQDKPTTVEMTVRIPIHADEVKYKWALEGAWAQGVRSQFDDGVSIYLPCSRCLQVVSYWVKCRHERENRWKATLIGAGESRCSNCGIRNRPTSDRIRLSAQSGDWVPNNRSGQQTLSSKQDIETNTRALLPCPTCQSLVEFEAKIGATADSHHPWADMKISPQARCDECGSPVQLKSNNIRLRGRDFG